MARIRGTKKSDRLEDKDKNDKIKARAGDDLIIMMDGGEDVVNGGGGYDVITYAMSQSPLVIDLKKGTAKDKKKNADTLKKIEAIDGSEFNDRLKTGEMDWGWLGGRGGDDKLTGRGFGDVFNGGSGNDVINGKGGWNIVEYKDDGFDQAGKIGSGVRINLTKGITIDGWGDKDTLKNINEIRGTHRKDKMKGDAFGNVFDGEKGNDVIHGGREVAEDHSVNYDRLYGGGGKDKITLVNGEAHGEEGNDRIKGLKNKDDNLDFEYSGAAYSGAEEGIVANLTALTRDGLAGGDSKGGFRVRDGFGGVDKISGVKFILDSAHDDVFYVDTSWSNNYGNFITIELSGGDDEVVFEGMVTVARISYARAGGAVEIDMEAGTATDFGGGGFIGNDSFTGANEVRGSNFDDLIYGSNGSDKRIRGDDGNDRLEGRDGDDRLDGEGGNDLLIGGAGFDTLNGGTGRDTFRFLTGDVGLDEASIEIIEDFSQSDGDLIEFDLGFPFQFIGTAAFTGKAGELRYQQSEGNTFIYGDGDGDGSADGVIALLGLVDLQESDFLL